MKKRMVSLLLVLVMLLGLLPTAALAAPVGGGSGTAEDPYLIATAQELVDFRDAVNDSAKRARPSSARSSRRISTWATKPGRQSEK